MKKMFNIIYMFKYTIDGKLILTDKQKIIEGFTIEEENQLLDDLTYKPIINIAEIPPKKINDILSVEKALSDIKVIDTISDVNKNDIDNKIKEIEKKEDIFIQGNKLSIKKSVCIGNICLTENQIESLYDYLKSKPDKIEIEGLNVDNQNSICIKGICLRENDFEKIMDFINN